MMIVRPKTSLTMLVKPEHKLDKVSILLITYPLSIIFAYKISNNINDTNRGIAIFSVVI